MTNREAIGWLKYAVPIRAVTSDEFSDFITAVNMAIDALKPQWIPCSERLPSDHERYLLTEEVHYTTGRIVRRVLMAFYDDENDEWYEEMGEDVEVVSYPLAWMPLPEPARLEDFNEKSKN